MKIDFEKIQLQIPKNKGHSSFYFDWDDFAKIHIKTLEPRTLYIKSNKKGLISLARHLLSLAGDEVQQNAHFHLDDSSALEPHSQEIIFERED